LRVAFDLGSDDRAIAQGNLHGVALAAIQGLHAKVRTLEARTDERVLALQRQRGA